MLGKTSLPLISLSKVQNLHSLEDNMAPKNIISQSSKKTIQSTSQGSTTASTASGGVMTRSMIKITAATAIEQSIVTMIQNLGSKVSKESIKSLQMF